MIAVNGIISITLPATLKAILIKVLTSLDFDRV